MTRKSYLLGALTMVLSAGVMLALGFSKVPRQAQAARAGVAEAPAAAVSEPAQVVPTVVASAPGAPSARFGFGGLQGQGAGFGAMPKAGVAAPNTQPAAASAPARRRYSRWNQQTQG